MRERIYGRNGVYESLRAGRRHFFQLRIADTVQASDSIHAIVNLATSRGVPIERVPRNRLDSLGGVNHQGLALDTGQYPYSDLDNLTLRAADAQRSPLFLILDLIQDPQNLGTLLRTAEAVGVSGVIIQRRRAAGITPAVVNASAGAVEHLEISQVTNIAQTLGDLKSVGVWVAGLEKAPGAQCYDQVDLTGPLGIVVGGEGKGMRRLVRERCDFLIELPMCGKITSLNAAVAGSIALYEVLRQRRQHIAG